MDDCNIFDALGQVSSSEAGTIFRNFLRGSVRHLIVDVMAAKVNELCGPSITLMTVSLCGLVRSPVGC